MHTSTSALCKAATTKTQFYGPDGFGRDTYIYNDNGGFCPEKLPCQIETLGKSILHCPLQIEVKRILLKNKK